MSAGSSDSPVRDFTSIDYVSLNEDLQSYARTRFPEDVWTSFTPSNPGAFLIELMAYAGDLLAFHINASVLETNPATVRKESNFRSMCRTLGYDMKGPSTSKTVVRFYDLPNPADPDYPPGMPTTFYVRPQLQVSVGGSIVFQPLASVFVDLSALPSSTTHGRYFDVEMAQGEEVLDAFDGTGRPDQRVALSGLSILEDTVAVLVNSEPWTRVRSLSTVASTEKVYTALFDADGSGVLTFGDGARGKVPPSGSANIQVVYRIGGGTQANVPIGAIDSISGTSDSNAYPVPVQLGNASVVNITDAEGGGPRQSLDNARANLPAVRRVNDRCISNDDYAAAAVELVPEVYAAIGVSGRPQGGSTPIVLLLVPNGVDNAPVLTSPSKALGNVVCNALEKYKESGRRIFTRGASFVNLEVEVDAFVLGNAAASKVKDSIEGAVLATYRPSALGFHPVLPLQDVYRLLSPSKVEGISHVLVKKFSILPASFRHVNSVTSGNGDIVWTQIDKLRALRREWLLRIGPSLGQYTVLERIVGQVSRLTDTVMEDDGARFTPNELVGWKFHPAPDEQDRVIEVVSNTETSFATVGGNSTFTSPNDDYVLERVAGIGLVLDCYLTGAVAQGATTLPVVGGSMLPPGCKALIRDGAFSEVVAITSATINSVTLAVGVSRDLTSGARLDYIWVSPDGSVQFSLAQGTKAFARNDEVFLDVFPAVGDLRTRREHFVVLEQSRIQVNTIGGVR